ncbi:hypothetical protein HRbin24_01463 [bacterium HR24]|jgi:hypothetical protein|nr:hypothetical protein HRbin24_01463 [bacterium HR24]
MGIDTLEDLRDVTIVAFTIAGTVVFLFSILVSLVLLVVLLQVRGLVSRVNHLVNDNLPPALSNLRESMETVRSTTAFVSDTVVRPVAKGYGLMMAARRFVSVLGRMRGRARAG